MGIKYKLLIHILFFIVSLDCIGQSHEFHRQYDQLQKDTNNVRILLVDGLEIEMMDVIKISTDTTPIGISPFHTIVIESTVSWTIVVGDSIIYGDVGKSKITLWDDKIDYIDVFPK